MFPVRDNLRKERLPAVTLTLVALNTLIYFWDRQWHFSGPNVVFADLAMRPQEVMRALGDSPNIDKFPLGTLFTSMFLHANLVHLLGNVIFLMVFGPSIERVMGGWRYVLYYIFWGVAASVTQVYVHPNSVGSVLGASGAIGGILGAYFVLFPSSKIEVIVPILLFLSFEIAAWILLGAWFLIQILLPQDGVANWAHVGGFLAGMVTVLIIGRKALLRNDDAPELLPATPI